MSKQDERQGRRHRTRKEADQLAAEYEASGLTQLAFSERRGVPLKTLARYVGRRRREAAAGGVSGRLVAVKLAGGDKFGAELTLLVAGGRRIEVKPGFDRETLQRLLAVVERG